VEEGPKNMIRNIIWDLDGTLFDTYPAILRAFRLALEDNGITISEERVRNQAQKSLTRFTEELVRKFGIDPNYLQERYLAYCSEYPLAEQKLFPGAREVCEYICSMGGINVIVTHRPWSSAKKLLRTYRMSEYFTFLLTVEQGYPLKPDPAMFEKVIENFELNREETLAVGDRDLDILAGKAAGLTTCLYNGKDYESEPDLVIDDYSQLLDFLKDEK
jgi:phosphoglycolate phosphatase-like HAD superfamily hydrolase